MAKRKTILKAQRRFRKERSICSFSKRYRLEAMHGYGIGQRIQQLAENMLQIEEGTLYPALYRIEQRGWIKADWGVSENNRKARFYALTRTGRKQLEEEEQQWNYLSLAVSKILKAQ